MNELSRADRHMTDPQRSFALSSAAIALACALAVAACTGNQTHSRDTSMGSKQKDAAVSSSTSSGDAGDAASGSSDFGNVDARVPLQPSMPPDAAAGDAGDAAVRPPDQNTCGSVELDPMVNTNVEPGNLLVVFDSSGSMVSAWGSTTRWLAAGNAVRDAVSSLAEYLTVGAIIFPSSGSSCGVDSIDSPSQIRFVPGAAFVAAWDNYLSTGSPSGGTPLGEALVAADTALSAASLSGSTRVVVLTDGEPNCDNSTLSTIPPMWLAQGIKTYVVGLPGSESAVTVLDDLAMAGGTMQHLTPNDSRTLRHQLADIVSETVTSALPSCSVPLDPAAPNPEDVHVVVTEQGARKDAARDLGDGGGWSINADGTEIDLFGPFCDQGLAGAYSRISIEYGCLDLPPLPPPPPVVVK